MTLWILLTILTAAVAVLVSIPLIRRLDAPPSDQDRLMQVSRDQLAEIEADAERGRLSEADAAEARTEVERRVLAAAKSAPPPLVVASETSRNWSLAILGGWIVVGATGLYAVLGNPELPAQPAAQMNVAAEDGTSMPQTDTAASDATAGTATGSNGVKSGSVEEAIASLITKLDANPEDAEGWRMLGWSYFNTERYADAAEAYAKAVKLDGSLPDVWSAYGETLVRSARGLVTDEAVAAFDAALKLNPQDPRAHFFKGMALEQAGDANAAIEAWIALATSAPEGADWLPGVVQRIDELAAANNIDIGTRIDAARSAAEATSAATLPPSGGLPAPAMGAAATGSGEKGPTAADVAAADEMTPEDRQAMINGMVDQLDARLRDNPDDPAGWAKLISSRMVLNDPDAAADAFQRAKEALAASPEGLAQVTEAALAAGLSTE